MQIARAGVKQQHGSCSGATLKPITAAGDRIKQAWPLAIRTLPYSRWDTAKVTVFGRRH